MSDEVTRWLARAALPLSGLTAGGSTADLQPLKSILDGVRIVGMGEATHGTSEFFRLKHRLLEFLVEEMGFSVLAMEAGASAGPAVDAYVRHGAGDAEGVLAGLGFWTWRTREVLGMIEWMREYNRGRPEDRKVRFVGIDPQQCGASLAALGSFLRKVAPDREAGLLSPLRVLATAYPGAHPDPERRLVRDAEELVVFLRGHGPGAADALRHARILVRAADLVTRPRRHTDPGQTVFAARDRYMAEAVGELLTDPSTKIALWAHNGHITKTRYGGAVPAMGQHLRARFGDAYYALGFLFGSGSFRARRTWPGPWSRPGAGAVVTHRLGPAGPDTLEARLATADPGDHLVDLRDTANAPAAVREWLNGRHHMRSFGAVVPRWTYRFHFSPVSPAEEYDGLAYVAVSTGSRPLPAS
ncbi:erythromycin esterase family protein [Streptomyces sp. enrichment culture]|uniref:erythromycin esterase family protein n=1 Tax=Streptomyces sp. enrichment culture TaxID=1795815 RepID=UPI003F54325A